MPILRRSFASFRRIVLYVVGFLVILLILRTPTAPYFSPGTPKEDNHFPRSRVSDELKQYLEWNPPIETKDHYPPYDGYQDRDHDPNRWEAFDQNNDLYLSGTFKSLHPSAQIPIPYKPYPEYTSNTYKRIWQGDFQSCTGPRGLPFNRSDDDVITAYPGAPKGFPNPNVGSWQAVGLDEHVCFDRFSRLGVYGLDGSKNSRTPNWNTTKWGNLQNDCLNANADRFEDPTLPVLRPGINNPEEFATGDQDAGNTGNELVKRDYFSWPRSHRERKADAGKKFRPRSALLIRTWDEYVYEENDKQAIRALINELSLQSGGEYHVFLFVNVKNSDLPIFTDDKLYQECLQRYVPEEFRDIAILWTEELFRQWYPQVGEFSVYWQQFMALQWFSKKHPEYEYIWNWEMDARLIGHHYHFVESITNFAKQQPRKYLWERNARYYLPAVHGSWSDFFSATNKIIHSVRKTLPTVWGPQLWSNGQEALGPVPPTSEKDDNYAWGVSEEADFISLLPMWDPRSTNWAYRDKLFNYPWDDAQSSEDRPYPHIPRRVFINTLARFSASLLAAMHYENSAGLSMASEMWPASIALQHGFKAVYAPHPIWQAHVWPPAYSDMVFNADGWGAGSMPGHNTDDGRGIAYDRDRQVRGKAQAGSGPNGEGAPARWGQERDAPYSPDREHNFADWSWYFWSDFPRVLYWRWLGWKAGFSIVTIEGTKVVDDLGLAGGEEWEGEKGRMCTPYMLLHPVKGVKRPEVDLP